MKSQQQLTGVLSLPYIKWTIVPNPSSKIEKQTRQKKNRTGKRTEERKVVPTLRAVNNPPAVSPPATNIPIQNQNNYEFYQEQNFQSNHPHNYPQTQAENSCNFNFSTQANNPLTYNSNQVQEKHYVNMFNANNYNYIPPPVVTLSNLKTNNLDTEMYSSVCGSKISCQNLSVFAS